MSLMIKGMDMPKNCYYCRFNYDNLCHALRASFSYIHENDISCPLSEIPTHGRLIDADKLMKVIEENDYTLSSRLNTIDRGMFTIGIKQAIDESPTIIEAEEA